MPCLHAITSKVILLSFLLLIIRIPIVYSQVSLEMLIIGGGGGGGRNAGSNSSGGGGASGGQVVIVHTFIITRSAMPLDLGGCAPGIYLLHLVNGENIRIVKE